MRSNYLFLAFAASLLFLIEAAPVAGRAESSIPGGYQKVSASGDAVIAAAAFAVKAQQEAMSKAAGAEVRLELREIVDAAEQVVAGANYRLRLKIMHEGAEKTAEAVVWWQSWRQPAPYHLIEWNWK